MTIYSKALTDWHNMLKLEDLSGTATPLTNPNPDTIDAFYMDVKVEELRDHKLASYARVKVRGFNGFPVDEVREFFFIKNRFVIVKDKAEFREGFLARVGPVWYTQNVGPQVGANWANTYMDAPVFLGARAVNPPYPPVDLLVYHAPHPGRKLVIKKRPPKASCVPLSVRYLWRGVVKAGQTVVFSQLLLPHDPMRRPELLARRVNFIKDTEEETVVRIEVEKGRQEWLTLNLKGRPLKADKLETDARYLYLDIRDGKVTRYLARKTTFITFNGREIHRKDKPSTVEDIIRRAP